MVAIASSSVSGGGDVCQAYASASPISASSSACSGPSGTSETTGPGRCRWCSTPTPCHAGRRRSAGLAARPRRGYGGHGGRRCGTRDLPLPFGDGERRSAVLGWATPDATSYGSQQLQRALVKRGRREGRVNRGGELQDRTAHEEPGDQVREPVPVQGERGEDHGDRQQEHRRPQRAPYRGPDLSVVAEQVH